MSGRTQNRHNAGRDRASNPLAYYRKRLPDIVPGEYGFIVHLIRPEKTGKQKVLDLGPAVTMLSWDDTEEVLSGSLSLKRADPLDPSDTPVHRFHRVRVTVTWQGRHYILWTMRVDGEPTANLSTGEMEVQLTNDLWALERTKRDWKFRTNKKHKHGWKAHQIARRVCQKEHVRIGRLATGKTQIEKMEKEDASGLEVIKAAYEEEKKETGIKFVIKFRNGRLYVLPFRRSKILYRIGGMAKEVQPEAKPKTERPHTVCEATGRISKKKKVTIRVFNRGAVRRFGESTMEKDYGRVKNRATIRRKAKRDLANEMKIERKATVTIPGVPFMERGDIVSLRIAEQGWKGTTKSGHKRSACFITGLRHSVSPEGYDVELDLTQVDPFLEDRKRRDKEQRERERANS